jgi:hypothetical protein
MPFKFYPPSGNGIVGKVGILPFDIRNEVNRRLEEGVSARVIAEWLNGDPSVRAVLEKRWKGQPIETRSIWSWKKGGYQDWLKKREHLEKLKELADYALKLGQAAGGSVADGSAAIAGGKIMLALEDAAGEDVHKMVRSISALRSGDFTKQKIELARKKMQRDHTELFLKWYADQKVRDIVESRANNAEKLELLGRTIFGEDW